jgi:hypothetical protein
LLNWKDCCFCPENLWMEKIWNLKSILLFSSLWSLFVRCSGEELGTIYNQTSQTARSEVGGWQRCMLFSIRSKLQDICSII